MKKNHFVMTTEKWDKAREEERKISYVRSVDKEGEQVIGKVLRDRK